MTGQGDARRQEELRSMFGGDWGSSRDAAKPMQKRAASGEVEFESAFRSAAEKENSAALERISQKKREELMISKGKDLAAANVEAAAKAAVRKLQDARVPADKVGMFGTKAWHLNKLGSLYLTAKGEFIRQPYDSSYSSRTIHKDHKEFCTAILPVKPLTHHYKTCLASDGEKLFFFIPDSTPEFKPFIQALAEAVAVLTAPRR